MIYEGCTLEEIKAFRALENGIFDFGEGPMKMEGLLGSEDAYYEMDIQSLEEDREQAFLDYMDYLNTKEGTIEIPKRINRKNKKYDKERNKKLNKIGAWWIISDRGTHLTRIYRGSRSGYIKQRSNKSVRKAKNLDSRGGYRKAYNFWYELW